jgi:hypothetical protein
MQRHPRSVRHSRIVAIVPLRLPTSGPTQTARIVRRKTPNQRGTRARNGRILRQSIRNRRNQRPNRDLIVHPKLSNNGVKRKKSGIASKISARRKRSLLNRDRV